MILHPNRQHPTFFPTSTMFLVLAAKDMYRMPRYIHVKLRELYNWKMEELLSSFNVLVKEENDIVYFLTIKYSRRIY